ncbi:transglycosylase SLT domain-containing protein [Streptomyces sp. HUAS ZL42]|uniref:transglycosylase SLT domain-containing protein n=1 Tax=Streptomyces sp. HUAS ZL42 TaxID=3231715 RepID=UPI00345E604E
MPKNTNSRGLRRSLTKQHKIGLAGVAALGAAAVAFSVVPANAGTTTTGAASSTQVVYSSEQIKNAKTDGLSGTTAEIEALAAQKRAAADALAKQKAEAAKKAAAAKAAAAKKAAAQAAAKKKAEAARKAKEAASRAAQRAKLKAAAKKTYPNNLDGWIRESLDVMKKHGIPGSYNGIYRNIIRESSGNPNAINNWDINAINGVPSKGLLQVIPPTFKAYHVPGTSWNIYDPVANITAACNYAADRYGSMDNVNSAY